MVRFGHAESNRCVLGHKELGKSPTGESMEREETDDMEEIRLAVESIISHFREPLEAKMNLKKLSHMQEST